MQLIEAALAFAITMLALSLVVSSFVEIIHRIFSMREAGLKYVLGQMFDQVLAKYVAPTISRAVAADTTIAAAARNDRIRELLTGARTAFVERMSANRAPMGVTPKATPTDPAAQVANNPRTGIRPVERPRSGRDDAGRVHGTARQHRCGAGDRRCGCGGHQRRAAGRRHGGGRGQCRAQGCRAEVRGVRQGSQRLFRGPRPVAFGGGRDRAGFPRPCRCGRSVSGPICAIRTRAPR